MSRCKLLLACAVWILIGIRAAIVKSLFHSFREARDKEGALKELEQPVYVQSRGTGGKDREKNQGTAKL